MERVVIIGSGNVATSLAHGLAARCEVAQIYSRTLAHAQTLADAIGCPATNDFDELVRDADVYIFSVKDDALSGLAAAVCSTRRQGLFLRVQCRAEQHLVGHRHRQEASC